VNFTWNVLFEDWRSIYSSLSYEFFKHEAGGTLLYFFADSLLCTLSLVSFTLELFLNIEFHSSNRYINATYTWFQLERHWNLFLKSRSASFQLFRLMYFAPLGRSNDLREGRVDE
jgi:hypothetical protein